jgi:DNA-binding CsgD family transcriptional regulator/PAS domain-containing protein
MRGRDDRLIHAIHEAALEPSLWPGMLEDMVHGLGATIGLFGSFNGQTGETGPVIFTGAPEDINERFLGQHVFTNPWMERSHKVPPGVVGTTDDLIPLREVERTEFYAEVVAPARAEHGLACSLASDQGWLSHVAMYRPRRRGPFGNGERRALQRLVPHIEQADRARRRFADLDMQRAAALDMLEVMPGAMVLVDAKLRIVFANAGARRLLGAGDGIGQDSQGLCGACPSNTAALRRCVSEATGTGADHGTCPGGVVVLPRPSGARPWVATIIPLRMQGLAVGPRRPAAAVFVADIECPPRPRLDRLHALFGLTIAEARVALLLAEGKGVNHVATTLGLSRSTVKTHLQRTLEKTGTNRQAELVKLVVHLGQLPGMGQPAAGR